MNSADRILLEGLRLVSDASDEVWELVVAEVTKAGSVVAVGGQARVEIERAVAKARTLVEKHPGQHDQSVHGGKKGGGGAPSSGNNEPRVSIGRRAEIDAEASAMQAKRVVRATPNQREIRPAQFTAERAVMSFEDGKKAKSPQEKQKKYRESAKQAKEASLLFEDQNFHDAAEAMNVMARMMNSAASNVEVTKALGATDADLQVEKAVSPVEKHPGHGDQSVHGGKKGGASSSTPASSAGGSSDSLERQNEAIDKVNIAGGNAADRMVNHSNEMARTIYGGKGNVGFVDSIDEVELMGISDSLASVAQSVAALPSSRKKSYKELRNLRSVLRETDSTARSINNKVAQRAARRAVRLHTEEVNAVIEAHREAWTGVGGLFDE